MNNSVVARKAPHRDDAHTIAPKAEGHSAVRFGFTNSTTRDGRQHGRSHDALPGRLSR